MEPSVVTKVVTDELSITTRFINGLKEFAMTRGIDFLEALIIFIIGYIICRYIRRAVAHILEKSDVDPSAKTFIEEIIFFFCLLRNSNGSRSISSSKGTTLSCNKYPSRVSTQDLPFFRSNSVFNSRSSDWIALLMEGWDTFNSCAAIVIFSYFAAYAKYRS